MKVFPACLLLLTAFPSAWAAEIAERPPLFLGEGEQRAVLFPGLARYSAGSDNIRLHPFPAPSNERVLIKGVRSGQADLWVWKKDGNAEHRTIHVEKLDADLGHDAGLLRALSRLEEAEIIHAGSGVLLRGEIKSAAEAARIRGLTRAFAKQVQDETELSEPLLKEGQGRLEEWLRSTGDPHHLSINRTDRAIWVHGSVSDATQRAHLEAQLLAVFPAARLELESLPDNAPTVHFKVFLLELKRDRMKSFGLSWPTSQEGAFRVTTTGITETLQLDAALQAMEGEGSVKILSNPELVVRAPGEAELFSGGELPIRTHTPYTTQMSWKSYGLTLKLNVTHAAGDCVRLDVSTEVSRLDPSLATDKVPGLQANRMKTQVDARYGIPLFLSGLLQEDTRRQARGLPGLRQIPVLGALFGSEDYQNDRSELVAILLPEKAPPAAPMGRFTEISPRTKAPPPRNWLSPAQQLSLTHAPEYPWNALQ